MSSEHKNGFSYIHDYDIDVESFTIYLMGCEDHPQEDFVEPGVEYRMANRFIRNLNYLSTKNSNDPILVIMKTCGGEWQEGMAIYDAIIACPNHVTVVNFTHARSMSSLILQAADKRIMMPNSTFMFHAGTFGFEGTCKQLKTEFHENERDLETMLDIYIDAMQTHGIMSEKSRAQIKRWLVSQMDKKEEVYFTAEQAVEYGFADEIFTSWKAIR
jgi:ATP-dependent protease ClpP protease subunit